MKFMVQTFVVCMFLLYSYGGCDMMCRVGVVTCAVRNVTFVGFVWVQICIVNRDILWCMVAAVFLVQAGAIS